MYEQQWKDIRYLKANKAMRSDMLHHVLMLGFSQLEYGTKQSKLCVLMLVFLQLELAK